MTASVKKRAMTFVEVVIRHRMASLQMLYLVTVTEIFKVKHLKRCYLENGENYRKNACHDF